jgi:membrane protein
VVLMGHPALQEQVMHSALSQFPVIGTQLGQPRHLSGGIAGIVVGIAGAVYGGLGAGQAVQHAMDTLWAVPRNVRPDPIRARIRSMLLLSVLGSALVATTLLAALGRASAVLGPVGTVGVVIAAVVVNSLVCLIGFRVSTVRDLSYRQLAPGAVSAAIVWQLVQWFGAVFVAHAVKTASVTNSVFALVLGLLAFLYLLAITLVFCAEINVVRVDRLYPRALLTPFTDKVTLTPGDRKVYAGQAKAQRAKGFEAIEVTFNPRPKGKAR